MKISFFYYDANSGNNRFICGNAYTLDGDDNYVLYDENGTDKALEILRVPAKDVSFIVEEKDGLIVNMYNPNDI